MTINKKTLFVLVLAGSLFLAFSAPLFAGGLWYNGMVTKAPWTDAASWVQIDQKTYTLMLKDDKFERHYQDSNGRWHGELWPIASLRVGQRVIFKAEDRRIYELYVEE
jgi:hypothetical protein